MLPSEWFRFCPRCGAGLVSESGQNPCRCAGCGLRYFFNPTCAAAGFLQDAHGRYLWIRRQKDPQKGKLAVPGGFIDLGETAEEALRRETREEVGLELTDLRYLLSCTNRYFYADVTYPVVDFIFTARALNPEGAAALDAVESILWAKLTDIDPQELAFPSLRAGYESLRTPASR